MPNLNDWTEFLEARILQETAVQNNERSGASDQRALQILDRLVAGNPDNTHFLKTRAWSQSVLDKDEDAVSSLIGASYAEMTNRLSGKNDTPKNWIPELENLKSKISELSKAKITASAVSW